VPVARAVDCAHRDRALDGDESPAVADRKREQMEVGHHASERQGGRVGARFHQRIDAKDNAWLTSYGGKSIAVFDKNGKPLTPPEGITFGGKLGLMQGVIVNPGGDVWTMNNWEILDSCFGNPNEALSTRCGGQGVTIFFAMTKPVSSPQIGPAPAPQ
jgi:hypothetical protein